MIGERTGKRCEPENGFIGGEITSQLCSHFTLRLLNSLYVNYVHQTRVKTISFQYVLRWVHTCNVTAYRNAVTLPVTDTIRSYDLNFHPVLHGVTVSCERYTVGFPVCYRSQKHHECKEGERSGRW
jgi:hypothetical protein